MKWIVTGVGATTGGVLGVPSLLSTLSPVLNQQREPNWRSLGPEKDYSVGEVKSARVESRLERGLRAMAKSVYVWRKSTDEYVVYSRSCTDLGCPVNYDPGSACFFCPCHGGIFSQDGERMAGPPKAPLYRYNTRVRDGFLEIDLASVPIVA